MAAAVEEALAAEERPVDLPWPKNPFPWVGWTWRKSLFLWADSTWPKNLCLLVVLAEREKLAVVVPVVVEPVLVGPVEVEVGLGVAQLAAQAAAEAPQQAAQAGLVAALLL